MAAAQTTTLGADDYQMLAGMLRSEDASVRAQGQSLAKKLTPDEQQQFFDVQQQATRGKDATSNRVDGAIVGGVPGIGSVTPEAALGVGLAGRAVAGAMQVPGAVAKTVAGAKAVVTQAAPIVKYEATKTLLEKMGVPSSMATVAAMAVSGYSHGKGATPAAAAETEAVAAPAATAAAEPAAAPAPKSGPRTINDAMADAVRKAQEQAAAARAAKTAPAPATFVAPPKTTVVAYRGDSVPRTVAELDFQPRRGATEGPAIWFSPDAAEAEAFGPHVTKAAIDTRDFLKVRYADYAPDGDPLFEPEVMKTILDKARAAKAPGVIVRGVQNFEGSTPSTSIAVLDRRVLNKPVALAKATSRAESARGGTPPPADRPPVAARPESPATPAPATPAAPTAPAKVKLTSAEADLYLKLRAKGKTDAQARDLIAAARQLAGQLPTDAQVRTTVKGRNTTGKWPGREDQ